MSIPKEILAKCFINKGCCKLLIFLIFYQQILNEMSISRKTGFPCSWFVNLTSNSDAVISVHTCKEQVSKGFYPNITTLC